MTVAAIIPQPAKELKLGDLECKRCSAPHYLIARNQNGFWWAVYDRDTRRYPFDHYDEFPHFRMNLRHVSTYCLGDGDAPHPQYGPIVVYKRKRFSATEVRQIWIQSGRKCHLCGKLWKLRERSRKGWHIDHIIPNIGGGKETEMMENFLVACATCNLRKGRGYTERVVKQALRTIFN